MVTPLSVVFTSADTEATLCLRAERPNYLHVEAKGPGFSAQRSAYLPGNDPRLLALFFEAIGDGRKPEPWASVESELVLTVETARVDETDLEVRIAQRFDVNDTWELTVILTLRHAEVVDELPALARLVNAVEN